MDDKNASLTVVGKGLVQMIRNFFEVAFWTVSGGFAQVDIFSLVPTVGVLSLIRGIALAVRRPSRALWLQGAPFLLSFLFVALSGTLFVEALPRAAVNPIMLGFLAIQLLLAVTLVVLTPASRWAAVAFGVFSISFAPYAAFLAAMALTGSYI